MSLDFEVGSVSNIIVNNNTGAQLVKNCVPDKKLAPLLEKIVIRDHNTISDLARRHEIRRDFISRVLHGRKKSKRVEGIIQAEWGISVAEFQSVTRDWLERKSQGRGYSEKEIKEFSEFVRARRLGISVEELRDRRNQTLGGLV